MKWEAHFIISSDKPSTTRLATFQNVVSGNHIRTTFVLQILNRGFTEGWHMYCQNWRRSSFGFVTETVADARNGEDKAGMFGVGFNFLTQLCHINVQAMRSTMGCVSP